MVSFFFFRKTDQKRKFIFPFHSLLVGTSKCHRNLHSHDDQLMHPLVAFAYVVVMIVVFGTMTCCCCVACAGCKREAQLQHLRHEVGKLRLLMNVNGNSASARTANAAAAPTGEDDDDAMEGGAGSDYDTGLGPTDKKAD